jgi:hypothetical protein
MVTVTFRQTLLSHGDSDFPDCSSLEGLPVELVQMVFTTRKPYLAAHARHTCPQVSSGNCMTVALTYACAGSVLKTRP